MPPTSVAHVLLCAPSRFASSVELDGRALCMHSTCYRAACSRPCRAAEPQQPSALAAAAQQAACLGCTTGAPRRKERQACSAASRLLGCAPKKKPPSGLGCPLPSRRASASSASAAPCGRAVVYQAKVRAGQWDARRQQPGSAARGCPALVAGCTGRCLDRPGDSQLPQAWRACLVNGLRWRGSKVRRNCLARRSRRPLAEREGQPGAKGRPRVRRKGRRLAPCAVQQRRLQLALHQGGKGRCLCTLRGCQPAVEIADLHPREGVGGISSR